MRLRLISFFILIYFTAHTQSISYQLSSKGDTLNLIDKQGFKQGKWVIQVPALRGAAAYEEEGLFVNNRKEGVWRSFNLMGDLIAIEPYRWGLKNGVCKYFTLYGLEREEAWKAMNPIYLFDTVDVIDPVDPNKIERLIFKNEGYSLKHGIWKYLNPQTGKLISKEQYFMNQLKSDAELPVISKENKTDTSKTNLKVKPKEVIEFEKKNAGKKKLVRDGRTSG